MGFRHIPYCRLRHTSYTNIWDSHQAALHIPKPPPLLAGGLEKHDPWYHTHRHGGEMPSKCLHITCHLPAIANDPASLGLCARHHQEFLSHRLPPAPRGGTVPIAQALELLAKIVPLDLSLREIGKIVGLPKDTIWRIKGLRSQYVRRPTWEKLQASYATKLYLEGLSHGQTA